MTDARYADADPAASLAIRAEDADDLRILAALVQDAVLTVADMAHDGKARRFSLLLTRFRWEDAEAARQEQRPFERVRSLLVISDALRVRHDGIDRSDPGTVMSLLDVAWQPGEDGTGIVTLTFAGDGTLAIDAECLCVDLRDVTRPHRAVSGNLPRHE